MATPDEVLKWWEARYRSLPDDGKRSFLAKPALGFVDLLDDDIVCEAIDSEPKIDQFVVQALARQVRRLRDASEVQDAVLDLESDPAKRSVTSDAPPNVEPVADGSMTDAPHAPSINEEGGPVGSAPWSPSDGWTEDEIEVVREGTRMRLSLGAIAQSVRKPPEEVEQLLSSRRLDQSAGPTAGGQRHRELGVSQQSRPAQRDRPSTPTKPEPVASTALPQAEPGPVVNVRKPKKKAGTAKKSAGGTIGGVSHLASGYSGKPRSTSAEYDNREECSACRAKIDPASAALHECWG